MPRFKSRTLEQRRKQSAERMKKMRAEQTTEAAAIRRASDRENKKKRRLEETPEVSAARRASVRAGMQRRRQKKTLEDSAAQRASLWAGMQRHREQDIPEDSTKGLGPRSYEKRSSMLMTSAGTCMHEPTALLSLWRLSASESYEKRSSILMTSAGTCMHEPTALSSLWRLSASESGRRHQQDDDEHQSETIEVASEVEWLQDSFEEMEVTIDDDDCNSVKNRLSDLASDMKKRVETTELSVPAADDEDIYVPTIQQRSTTSEFLLECEEEELEPWQKHTLRVRLKEEEDVGEWSMSHQILEEHVMTKQIVNQILQLFRAG